MKQASSALRKAQQVVDTAFYRVKEWVDKYPNVSFRKSPHALTLLGDLYTAEKERAKLTVSKEMSRVVILLIEHLLETDPDHEPPSTSGGPSMGPPFFSASTFSFLF